MDTQPGLSHASHAREQRILIVDDTPVNVKSIMDILRDYGYHMFMASSGPAALERVERVRPDLILLDVMMSDMDGFEVCRRLKANPATRHIPVIFMTILESTEHKLQAFAAGAVDYVTKPVQNEELFARVSTHLWLQKQAAEIHALNEELQRENIRVRSDLLEMQQQYQTLIEKISDGYFVAQDDVIIFANAPFAVMHGYLADEAAGRRFTELVAPESRKAVAELFQRADYETSRSHFLFNYQRLAHDGQTYPTELTLKTAWFRNQFVTTGICRDITERIAMEHKLHEAEQMAYIGRVTSSLSHELRNPLSSIKMTLQMLAMNAQLDADDRRSVEVSTREVARLEGILNELLEAAKPIQVQREECRIPQIIQECLDVLRVKLASKDLTVELVVEPQLPSILADAQRLTQVMINLLLNAFDALSPGGCIRLSAGASTLDGQTGIHIQVEDSGPGLPEGYEQEVFEPFFTTKTQGTGLGLATVKQIIEAHGGRITAENRQPRGACFRIWLPGK